METPLQTVLKAQKKEENSLLQKRIEELEATNRQLVQTIDDLMRVKKKQEEKNSLLQEQINELTTLMKESEKQIDRAKKNSTINDMKIEPKIYLKGMFECFEKEKNALKILIDGTAYYYPLSQYQCKHLPVSGARVLIFKSEDGENLIYGFNVGNMIDNAEKVKASVQFVSSSQKRLKLQIEGYGFINFTPDDDFWEKVHCKIGDTLILNQVFIDGDVYFYIANYEESSTVDRNAILKTLYGEEK